MPYTQNFDAHTADTSRTPSLSIWNDCPTKEIAHNPAAGYHFFDDFIGFPPFAEADDVGSNFGSNYFGGGSDGVTLAQLADTDFGQIQVAANDADNDGHVLVHGNAAGFARLSTSDRMWFEARISKASIADNAMGFFIGLCEITVPPTSVITLQDDDTDPDLSEDFVGFNCLAADGDVVECIYQEGGATLVNVGDANTAIAAATFYKFGMTWNGAEGRGGVLRYFLDGKVVQTLNVTSALSFPDANHLAMIWATKTGAAAAVLSQMDWWRVAATGGNT